MNASTEAIAGALIPTELLIARRSNSERTYLARKKGMSVLQHFQSENENDIPNLALSIT